MHAEMTKRSTQNPLQDERGVSDEVSKREIQKP